MVLDASGPKCYCQARGCWEVLASGPALESWFRSRSSTLRDEDTGPGAEEICELARQGDPLAQQAVARESHYLGLGLANLVTLFCPDIIALGGGLMKSAGLLLPGALEIVREICTQVPVENSSIVLAGLGPDAGVLGAARVWYDRIGDSGR